MRVEGGEVVVGDLAATHRSLFVERSIPDPWG